ncbi:MAG TPA: STT3 domain-containing protein [Solirubrobacteraceae bacterium]
MGARDRARWVLGPGLVLVAAAVVLWVRLLPLSLALVPEQARDLLRYRGADGREHVYLGDYDSYLWVRHARNVLRSGTTCDAVVAGECRDTYANAPVGAPMRYGRSLHIVAIVALHRVLDRLVPGIPLTASAYWVPVLVGLLGVPPAVGIGWRLAGPLAGLISALAIGLNPLFLQRSIGGDNDVWNVVLPLWAVWAGVEALEGRSPGRRVALAALAGGVVALHAATWSGWLLTGAVLTAGFAAAVLLSVLRALAGRERPPVAVWTAAGSVVFALAMTAGVVAAGGSIGGLSSAIVSTLVPAPPPAPAAPTIGWPDVFETVGELTRPQLANVAGLLEGPLYFFAAWLGLLLLLLPDRRWQWWHFAVLIGGNFLYRYLVTTTGLFGWHLARLLALPLLAGGALAIVDRDDRARLGGLVVVAWFLAALVQSFAGLRFVMLLVPPFGILLGVAVGRLHAWVLRVTTRGLAAAWRPRIAAALFAALAAVVIPIVGRGAAAARAYLPVVHDAWWDALTRIRETAPPDAIVTAWWDYGHWIKYVAERRVTSDGSTLSGHVAHWIGRTLLAPTEREAIGLLRMLDCGSDVGPEGAMGRLAAHGVAEPAAHELVIEVASLERDEARARLLARGLEPTAADDVLAATHCTPPPAYLLLTSAMIQAPAWRHLGSFDPRRALAVSAVRAHGADAAVAELERTFALSGPAARALVDRAAGLRTPTEIEEFVNPRLGYLVPTWLPCTETATGEWRCPVGRGIDVAGTVLETVTYRPDAPAASRLHIRRQDRTEAVEPAVLLVAGAAGIDEVAFAAPPDERLGVLVDVSGRRVLVGPPYLVRSTFTQLMFLDGRYATALEKTDDRTGFAGERIVTWRVRDRPAR